MNQRMNHSLREREKRKGQPRSDSYVSVFVKKVLFNKNKEKLLEWGEMIGDEYDNIYYYSQFYHYGSGILGAN